MSLKYRSGRPRGRVARWTVPFTIPAVLGVGLAAVLVSGGTPKEIIQPVLPAGAGGAVAPLGGVVNSPAAGTGGMTPGGAAVAGSVAGGGDMNRATQTAGGGGGINRATQVAGITCSLIVPANPLTAQGLATPYQLTGPNGTNPRRTGCTMANSLINGTFVQATILNPATGALSVYEPLVVTQGTAPAAVPVMPTVPAGAVVTVDIGYNGAKLSLLNAAPGALQQGNCVNGLPGSVFGEVAFCNGTQFVAAAAQAAAAGRLTVPALGTSAVTGQPCPSTRSFTLVDQDPSDNVTTKYLLNRNGQTAQATTANMATLPRARTISNASDNIDLTGFVDKALGCTPFMAPDLTQAGTMGTSQALNELSANAGQAAPAALVPLNDPMVMVGKRFSAAKVNLYRSNIGEPLIGAAPAAAGVTAPTASAAVTASPASVAPTVSPTAVPSATATVPTTVTPAASASAAPTAAAVTPTVTASAAPAASAAADTPAGFCQNLVTIQPQFLMTAQNALAATPTPVAGMGRNLLQFLVMRLGMSFTNLNCQNFGLRNPVRVMRNDNGVPVAVALNGTAVMLIPPARN